MPNTKLKLVWVGLKIFWVVIALLLLAITLYGYDGEEYSDIWIVFTWGMLIISFPAGLLVSLIHLILNTVFSVTIATSYISLSLEWAVYFVLGYLQWFKLIPYVACTLKERVMAKD
ncbi:MAG: hypothetical protein JXA04_04845 [Gammaproteobacteria bacterium]|nr:hypothetical protein [Gammaproteobacteria bacterium]